MGDRLLPGALGAACLLAGLFGVSHGWNAAAEGWASRSWPTTSGVDLESEVVVHRGGRGGRAGGKLSYEPMARYRYAVDGSTCTADRVFTEGYGKNSRTWALDIVREYYEGMEIEVHYHPDEPWRAVLIPGARGGALAWMVAGFVLVLLGALPGYAMVKGDF